jgi:hypothetical protein
MVRSQDESYSEYLRRPGAYLHPSSSSFGTTDAGRIRGSFLAAGRYLDDVLVRLSSDLASGAIGVQRYTTATRAAIRATYFQAYSLGALSVFPFYTLTERDTQLLDEELQSETGFLSQFARAIARGRVQMDLRTRIGLYVLALRGIFERGRLEAMPPYPVRWQLGIDEHCDNCLEAAFSGPYQQNRFSGLGLPVVPGIPGDGRVCLGLTRCGCTLVLESGIPLPNADLTNELREVLLEVVHGSRTDAGGASPDT